MAVELQKKRYKSQIYLIKKAIIVRQIITNYNKILEKPIAIRITADIKFQNFSGIFEFLDNLLPKSVPKYTKET